MRSALDLQLYYNVLYRFRVLVAAGFALACLLTFLSVATVGFASVGPTVDYRKQEVWESKSRILLTQRGFPWGRAILKTKQADAPRFFTLAELYAELVKSDQVRALAQEQGPLDGSFTAAAMKGTHDTLPLITVTGSAHSPEAAEEAANRGVEAFRQYLVTSQDAAKIKRASRVETNVVFAAREADLVDGRSMTLPVVVFLAVMLAVVALAFVLNNLRPQVHAVESELAERLNSLAAAVDETATGLAAQSEIALEGRRSA